MENIRYIGIGRTSDATILLNYLPDKKNKPFLEAYLSEFSNILQKLTNPTPNQRNTRNSQNGVWHSFIDENLTCFSGKLK